MADEVEQYVLQISAEDRASATVNQVNAALTQTLAQTQQLNLVNAEASTSYSTLADAATQLGLTQEQLVAMVGDTDQLVDANQQLAQSYDQVAQSAANAAGAEDDSGGSGGGLNITGSRRGLTALGSLAGGSPELSEAARLISVTAAFGGFGLVLGAGAIALKTVTDAEAARGKAAQDTADQLNQIAQGAAGGTTESINKQLSQYQAQAQTLDDARSKLTLYNDELQQNAKGYEEGTIGGNEYLQNQKNLEQSISDLTGGTSKLGVGQTDLNDLLADNQKNIDSVNISIGGLNIELGTQAVKTNDAALASQRLAKTQEDAVNLSIQVDGLTKEQRDTRAAQDQREISLINDRIQAGGLSEQATYDLSVQQEKLYDDYRAVTSVSETYADQLLAEEQAKQALTDANQKTLDLLTQEGDIRDKIASTEADIQTLRTDAAAQQVADLADEQSKIADIQQSGAEKQQEIAENNEEAKQKIQAQFALDDQTAIGNRDAYADDQARKKEQLALTNQQVTDDKQVAAENATEQKQIAQALAAYQKSEANLEQSLAKELAAKDRTLQQEQTDLTNILNAETALSQEYSVGIVSTFEQAGQALQTIGTQIVSGFIYNLNAAAYGGATTPVPYSQFTSPTPLPPVSGTAAGQQQHVVVNVNGMGMSLGEVLNTSLGLIDTLFRGNN